MQLIPAHRRKVEEAIHAAEHPKGMSVHDGMARINASILRRLLAIVDSITVPEGWQVVPVEPTREMIEAGAQRLVSWEDGCVWPDSWSPLQVSAARNEADRVWRSMWLAAASKPGDSNE